MPVIYPLLQSQGFHTLFGDVRDKNVTFVVDTSESMYAHLDTVKKHLMETLLAKAYCNDSLFNIVEFSQRVNKWCDRMVTCSPDTVYGAMGWIRSLEVKPGRDLLNALRAAFDDPTCQAVYMVTNGLPENRKEVLQVASCESQGRPVHIFFLSEKWIECDVQQFLQQLAQCTRGSCHLIGFSTGDVKQVVPVYPGDCFATGPFNSDLKYCSIQTALDRPSSIDLPHCYPVRVQTPWCTASTLPPRCTLTSFVPACPISTCESADILESCQGLSQLMIGTRVLARREPDGYYYLGTIKQEVEGRRGVFLIDFVKPALVGGKYQASMQKTTIVDIIQYTEAHRHDIIPGDKVLAPWETDLTRYGPGTVVSGIETRDPLRANENEEISVRFWNGKEAKVPKGVAFWIPSSLYERTVKELHEPLSARENIMRKEIVHPETHTYTPRVVPMALGYQDLFCRCHRPCYLSSPCRHCRGTCCVPTHPVHNCDQHRYLNWWPLTPRPTVYAKDPNHEELDRKVTAQLEELKVSKKAAPASLSSSEEESDSDQETSKPTAMNRAVNTDSSLFEKPRSPSPDRPDWKYWKRSHAEPHHKKPASCVSRAVKSSCSSGEALPPELWAAGPTNNSAMFNSVEHSPERRTVMKEVLTQSGFKPSYGPQGPPVECRLGASQVLRDHKHQEVLKHIREKKIHRRQREMKRELEAEHKYNSTHDQHKKITLRRLCNETQKVQKQSRREEQITTAKQLQKENTARRIQSAVYNEEEKASRKLAYKQQQTEKRDAWEAEKVKNDEVKEKQQQDSRRKRVEEHYKREAEKVQQAEKERLERERRTVYREV
ncbi:uncharacterized protein C11orf16 homolog [Polyodon spathula]|uniref:uncharacterized protein C11orf16 homolog n=1 Tax=Polyodon spathula TaxID=7913 RepID=UPI001B7E0AA0|nr:uncharacterized protein C11orf16 homolog [Polyodon spathula]